MQKKKPGQGLRLAVQQRLSAAIVRIQSDRPSGEALHSVRKRLKELRAILRLVRTPCATVKQLTEIFRQIGRRTTQVRDAQVTARSLQQLAMEMRGTDGFEWCEARRKKAAGLASHANNKVLRREVHSQLNRAAALLEQWTPENLEWTDVLVAWKKARKRTFKAMELALAEPLTENLHKWRKRAKIWWYQTELLGKNAPGKTAGLSRRLEVLTELIGEDHDLSLIEENFLKSRAAGASTVLAALKKHRARLQKKAAKRGLKIAKAF